MRLWLVAWATICHGMLADLRALAEEPLDADDVVAFHRLDAKDASHERTKMARAVALHAKHREKRRRTEVNDEDTNSCRT